MIGVDITPSYIEFAREEAKREGVQADFEYVDTFNTFYRFCEKS